jgi:hypothetical protein
MHCEQKGIENTLTNKIPEEVHKFSVNHFWSQQMPWVDLIPAKVEEKSYRSE